MLMSLVTVNALMLLKDGLMALIVEVLLLLMA